jgi:hypothetical protein
MNEQHIATPKYLIFAFGRCIERNRHVINAHWIAFIYLVRPIDDYLKTGIFDIFTRSRMLSANIRNQILPDHF